MNSEKMVKQEKLFWDIAENLSAAVSGKMFGKLCIKVNGKAFASYFQEEMVFKLSGVDHETALKLDGAKLWDTSGKKRPMKEGVQVPFEFKTKWMKLAQSELNYVQSQQK